MIANPQTINILILLITGIVVGFACGLLGVGGGFIMVPVQIWTLSSIGVEPTIATRVALGTSLAVILPTAISGCREHACRGVVLWRPGIALGLSGLLGAFLGGTIAAHAPADILQRFFGVVVLFGALRMLLSGKIAAKSSSIHSDDPIVNLNRYFVFGLAVGIISGLSGIGGGVILVPAMVIAMGFRMHQAVGTSSIAIGIISVGGILSYAINGLGVPGRLPYSLGYIDLFQWVLLAGSSIFMAEAGIRVAYKIPAEKLTYIFISVMLHIGVRMRGALGWFHLAF